MSEPENPSSACAGPFETMGRRSFLRTTLSLLLYGFSGRAARAMDSVWTTYQTPESFVAQAFGGATPPVKLLDLDANLQAQIGSVFGHAYPQSRLHYWRANGRSVWILDDVGKEGYQPTTAGFAVQNGAIVWARVLVYRESRGEQVAQPSFLNQLNGARLNGAQLDRSVTNISGATLSVLMMQRMARLALKLDALAP